MNCLHLCRFIFSELFVAKLDKVRFPYTFYSPIVFIDYENSGFWTAEITIDNYLNNEGAGKIKFMFENAPEHLCASGNRFIITPGYMQQNGKQGELVVYGEGTIL